MNPELFLATPSSSIRDCMELIDLNTNGIVFITNDVKKGTIIGVATDGDIRDALLKNALLDDVIENYYNKDFIWFDIKTPREEILKNLDNNIKVIPILQDDKTLFDIATKEHLPLQNEQKIYARAKAPARITFGGGGSDLTHFFVKNNGAVINATISIYCHFIYRSQSKLSKCL